MQHLKYKTSKRKCNNLPNRKFGRAFLGLTQKTQPIKAQVDTWEHIAMENPVL